jgi:uncharacterized protein (DUF302 family)
LHEVVCVTNRVAEPRYITKRSRYAFVETVDRLASAIRDAGNTVFATIDQSAAARQVGLDLQPTVLLIFGNPRGGTLLMAEFPDIALQLPLKLVVSESPGGVVVLCDRMTRIAPEYGVAADHPAIVAMAKGLETLTESIAAA